jgi:2-amino-4-hydroxy-6-hydroxymethyldihydropteridine diphosphokinase
MLALMTFAYVALGSNLGKRQAALRAALARLAQIPHTKVTAIATFRQTSPVDCPPNTPPFINSVAEIDTSLNSEEFMRNLARIESELGRQRGPIPNAPRTIDLDLLLFGSEVRHSPELTIPHPRMHLRAFVLEPLAEIAPFALHPIFGKTSRELLADLRKNTERAS